MSPIITNAFEQIINQLAPKKPNGADLVEKIRFNLIEFYRDTNNWREMQNFVNSQSY